MEAIANIAGEIETVSAQTTHAYFDLKSYISRIGSADVAAQMAQAVCFTVDLQMAQATRNLMKIIREEHDRYGYDTIGAMTDALRDQEFAEECIREFGKEDLGPLEKLAQLNCIRAEWNELAKELTGMTFDWQGIPRTYEDRGFEEFLTREIKLQVKPQVVHRIRVGVERRAADAPKEDIERVVQKRIALEEQRAKDKSHALMEQQDTLLTLYLLASEKSADILGVDPYEDVQFHTLSADIRRALIDAALRGASRAEDFATASTSITDAEFDQISFAVMRVERELRAVLAGPAYAVARATEL